MGSSTFIVWCLGISSHLLISFTNDVVTFIIFHIKKASTHFKEVNNYGNDIEDHLKPTVRFTCYLFQTRFTVPLSFALAICRLLLSLLTFNSVHVKITVNQVFSRIIPLRSLCLKAFCSLFYLTVLISNHQTR